jgi:hypothetical protein
MTPETPQPKPLKRGVGFIIGVQGAIHSRNLLKRERTPETSQTRGGRRRGGCRVHRKGNRFERRAETPQTRGGRRRRGHKAGGSE